MSRFAKVEKMGYLRKCAHASVKKYIAAFCSHVHVILFIYFAIKIGSLPPLTKGSKGNKSIEKKQVELRSRISLLMFDVVVLARGGEARQHHKDVPGFYAMVKAGSQFSCFCDYSGSWALAIRSAVSPSPFFSFACV